MNKNKKISSETKRSLDLWSFPWPLMHVLIGGKSSIDLTKLSIKSKKDAYDFIQSYGYDLDSNKDKRKMHSIIIESLHFIEEHLMPREWKSGVMPPKEIILCQDPRDLLIWASSKDENEESIVRQIWSCALLKLIHTISHLDDVQRLNNLKEARSQIIGRFHKAVFRDKHGKLWLGSKENCIELVRVDWKPYKQRDSMILKLLHKPANVSETIYDLIGVRIVTKKLSETVLAVKFLRQFYLVDFANTHPSRARNNLIDLEQFHRHLEMLLSMLKSGRLSIEEFKKMVDDPQLHTNSRKNHNPHSSREYRSIQITCRQRVRYKDTSSIWQDKLFEYFQSSQFQKQSNHSLADIKNISKSWELFKESREISIFFPFEVQIMNEEAVLSIEKGEASHDKYKKAQIRTARRRILSKILNI